MDLISLIGRTSDIRSEIRLYHPLNESTPPQRQPLHDTDSFKKLVEGFEFSRWFILTYQAAVVAVVLLVAACRLVERYRRVRRWKSRIRKSEDRVRKRQGEGKGKERVNLREREREGSASSGSSASSSSAALSPREDGKGADEWTALLDGQTAWKPRGWTAPWRYVRSALMYQPAPVRVVQKVLPPNTTSVWILTLFALNLFYALFNIGWHSATHDVLSDRAGLLFVANLPWLYLLAAKNQPLKYLTGDSYENLNMLHRRLGEWMCFLAVVHLVGMLWGWYDLLRPAGFGLWRFLTIPYVLWGCGAWVAYEVLYVMSLGSLREWWYEVFLGSHVLLQAAALVTLFLHHFRGRPYVGITLAIFLLDRFIWRLGMKSCVVDAELKVLEDGETVMVSADWDVVKQKSWMNRNMMHGWCPSEHVFISVPGMKRKHKWQFHPMTIASAAPALEGQRYAWFNLIIRAKGGFSRDLLQHAKNHERVKVRLDGPYGSLHALEMLRASDVAVVVAGGSGIAVAYPLLWDLLHEPERDSDGLSRRQRQSVCLIWIIQEASHMSWIGAERLEELRQMGLRLIIPPPSRSHGRPDVRTMLEEQVGSLCDGDDGVGVVVSGPDGLNRSVQNCCAEMVRRGREMEVAVEKFGW